MIYGFKKRFIAPILAGTKLGTIRAPRVGRGRHARVGDALQLKAGPRYRPVVFADTVCSQVLSISLIHLGSPAGCVVVSAIDSGNIVKVIVCDEDLDAFAIGDGFEDWDDLCRFWRDTHNVSNFEGMWIRWVGAEMRAR